MSVITLCLASTLREFAKFDITVNASGLGEDRNVLILVSGSMMEGSVVLPCGVVDKKVVEC
jgi:hypothetical protein